MNVDEQIAYQKKETENILASLLENGVDLDDIYAVEHHFSAEDYEQLYQFATLLFKKGYQVYEIEEYVDDEDNTAGFCFDIEVDSSLQQENIDSQCDTLIRLCVENEIYYDGWGVLIESDL